MLMSTETYKFGWRNLLSMVKWNIRLGIRGLTIFKLNFIMTLINIFSFLAIYFFMRVMIGSYIPPLLRAFNNDWFAYVFLGIMLSAMFGIAMYGPSGSVSSNFWSGRFEFMLMPPGKMTTLVTLNSMWSFTFNLTITAVYLAAGFLFFGLTLAPGANYMLAIGILILSLVAIYGLGLISASMFTMLRARAGTEPTAWYVGTFVSILSGVFFPAMILPTWLQVFGLPLPQIYAQDAIRRALLGGTQVTQSTFFVHDSLPFSPIVDDIIMLIILTIILLPLGLYLFRKSLGIAKKTGALSRWV